MTDHLTKKQRSINMRAVKSKDSKIELKLRHSLWKLGYRYRKNYSKVFGKPDIVFIRKKVAVFVDSEFWHGKDWERQKYQIKSNRAFWTKKIEGNLKRDIRVNEELRDQGWVVLRFWGDEIKNKLDTVLSKIIFTLNQK